MNQSKWRGLWKKIVFVTLVVVVCTLLLPWNSITSYNQDWGLSYSSLICYEMSGNRLPELDENEPKLGFSIFFHETSCPRKRSDIPLNARQSCSIESALRAHPNLDVFLLINTPVLKPLQETENVFVLQLLSYPNFKPRHIKFGKYVSSTPLNKIYKLRLLNYSIWPVEHASDVLRYTTLYKFGGIYLDLDILVLKPLTELKNFAGIESNTSVGSGILGFSFDKIGREVATQCAKELARTYDGKDWGFNGPGVITRTMEKRCNTTDILKMTMSPCRGFHVFPVEYFQAVSFKEPELLFEEGNAEKVAKMVNKSYVIHCWNKMSSDFELDNRLNIPYINYAREYCPRIYAAAGGNFN